MVVSALIQANVPQQLARVTNVYQIVSEILIHIITLVHVQTILNALLASVAMKHASHLAVKAMLMEHSQMAAIVKVILNVSLPVVVAIILANHLVYLKTRLLAHYLINASVLAILNADLVSVTHHICVLQPVLKVQVDSSQMDVNVQDRRNVCLKTVQLQFINVNHSVIPILLFSVHI